MLVIETVADLLPGDVGFTTIPGRVGAGVALGQALLRDECWFTHTWIVAYASKDTYHGPDGNVTYVEAMPGGARRVKSTNPRIGPGFGYIRLPLTDAQRVAITPWALERVGTPYSFLDYLSIALLHLGLPRRLVADRVTSSQHMICSQLVDAALTDAGFRVFDDGRLPQDVTPGALFRRLGALGEVQWW